MVQTLAINANSDLFIGTDGNIDILTGNDAIMQNCLTATRASLGEMVLAQNAGIPFFQSVFVGSPNFAIFSQAITKTLLNVSGVVSVTNLQISTISNILNYSVDITTIYGIQTLTNSAGS